MKLRKIALGVLGALVVVAVAGWFSLDKETRGLLATLPTNRDVLFWSQPQRDAATLVKLLRVAMLLPVIVVATMITRARAAKEAAALAASGDDTAPETKRPPLLPGFAVAFALLVVVNSTGFVPHAVQTLGSDVSRWFLVAAIAGIGMKAQLKELITVGLKPVALMVGETAFLAGLVLLLMRWLG